jgi:hypothetical protein
LARTERQRMLHRAVAEEEEAARIRRVVAFAVATGCPRGAWWWLLRLSREAEARRAAGARDAATVAPLPTLPPGRGRG